MNIVFQFPKCVMIIGMGHAAGFSDVPDARVIKDMPAAFMSTMFIPGDACPADGSLFWSSCAAA